jgi:hypothetical protein
MRLWANNEDSQKRVYCLLDVAGSGKSTVAKHMVEEWEKENRLVARFFFSRDTDKTMDIDSFCSTVAGAFATLSQQFRRCIDRFKQEKPDFELRSFQQQFEGLVACPLQDVEQPTILIIDALDECSVKGRQTLLEAFSSHLLPSHFRIFATGRPEEDIKSWANQHGGYANFRQLEGSNKDVDLYIESRLSTLLPAIRSIESVSIETDSQH